MKKEMYKVVIVGFIILLMVQITQAEELKYGLLWRYDMKSSVSGVSISSDGLNIVTGSGNKVYYFNREGKLLWDYATIDAVTGVSISADGSYIAAGSSGNIYFFNREGQLLWHYKTGRGISGVSVSSDGSYIAAGSGNKVYFFDKMGTQLWNRSTDFHAFSVSVSSNGSYIVAGSGRYPYSCEISYSPGCGYYSPFDNIYFFNKEGKLIWSREGRFPFISVSMSSNGSYVIAVSSDEYSKYFPSRGEYSYEDDKAYLFDLEGKLLWYLRINEVDEMYRFGKEVSSISLSSDGSYISVGSVNNNVYLLNRNGQVVWSYEIGSNVNSVAISSDGSYIAAGSFDGNVYFFARQNTPISIPTSTPNITSSPTTDQSTFTNSIGMEFVQIPAGEFDMGSPSNEKDRDSDEGLVHRVKITNAFYMGKYEVTQKQWLDVMGNNPSYFKGDSLPVEQVSWYDVQEFIKKLNEKEGTNKYRLPSEAEWEYSARAGTTTRYSFGDDESKLGDYAWYRDNSNGKTHEVGQKKPNPWGLYDVHGNVWEWVQDTRHSDYNGAPPDGSAWEGGGSDRVYRGGSWYYYAGYCRSANRDGFAPAFRYSYLGFRLVMDITDRINQIPKVTLMVSSTNSSIPTSAFPSSMLPQEISGTKINNIGINNLVMVISFIVFIIIYLALRPKQH